MLCVIIENIVHSTFNLENVNGQDGGQYRCVASNQCGDVLSDYFTIYGKPQWHWT